MPAILPCTCGTKVKSMQPQNSCLSNLVFGAHQICQVAQICKQDLKKQQHTVHLSHTKLLIHHELRPDCLHGHCTVQDRKHNTAVDWTGHNLCAAPLVVTADEICALLRGSTFLAWRCSITGEGLQEGPGPFELSLALPVPPALLLTHQLHHLHHHHCFIASFGTIQTCLC